MIIKGVGSSKTWAINKKKLYTIFTKNKCGDIIRKNTLENLEKMNIKEIRQVSRQLVDRSYWNKVNAIEFWAFSTKLAIIFPGLLFGKQFWWLYIFALVSSVALILTSTIKTLPTIIYFNVGWSILATAAIAKHFL